MKPFVLTLYIFIIAFKCAVAGNGTGTLKGKVTENGSGDAVIGATVALQNTTLGTVANSNGEFSLKKITAGKYTVRVSAIGYAALTKNVEINPEETITLNVTLEQASTTASEVIVSASKYEQSRVELSTTTSLVSQKTIEAKPIQTLDQVLETVTGVDVSRAGGNSSSNVQIRGSNGFSGGGLGTRIIMLYDGFPMNSPDANSVNWQSVSMSSVDRLEIVKGAASSLYGSAAMGGVINAIGLLPTEMTIKARFTNGIYDTPPSGLATNIYPAGKSPYFYDMSLSQGNRIGDFTYYVTYSRQSDEGYEQNSTMLLDDIKLKARFNLTGSQYLQLSTIFNWSKGGEPSPWATSSTALAFPTQPYYLADDLIKNQTQMVGLTYGAVFNSNLSMETKVYFHRDYWLLEYYPTYNPAFGPYQQYALAKHGVYNPNDPSTYDDSDARRYGLNTTFNYLLGERHHIVGGVEANIDNVHSILYHVSSSFSVGGFVQDEIQATSRLKISAGLRYDLNHVNQDSVTYLDYTNVIGYTKNPDGTQSPVYQNLTKAINPATESQLSPRISANYMINDETSVRASAGRSFRAPSLGERFVTNAGIFYGNPNPSLNAERMTSYEIGFFKSFSKYVSIDVAAYSNNYSNLIESVNINPNPTSGDISQIIFQYINVAQARIMGVETTLNLKPIDQWDIQLGYNYMDARDLDTASTSHQLGGNNNPPQYKDVLPYRPSHNLNFNTNFTLAGLVKGIFSNLSFNYSGRYVSKINSVAVYQDPIGKDYPGNFLVMNAGFRFKVAGGLNIIGTVQNLTNTQYEELEHYLAPYRSFHLGFDFNY